MTDALPHETEDARSTSECLDADRAGLVERYWAPPETPPLLDGVTETLTALQPDQQVSVLCPNVF